MIIKKMLFQLLFYTGSWIKETKYKPLLDNLKNPYIDEIKIHKTFEQQITSYENSSILIGHSLGGYFALRDAIKYPTKVAGVVLINSHFNSRGVMPYLRTSIRDVQVPVITILAENDKRLPISKSMDDLWASIQYNHKDKFFVVNKNMSHLSGIINEFDKMSKITDPIVHFINGIKTSNYTNLLKYDSYLKNRFNPNIQKLSTNTLIASQSTNVIDSILLLTTPFFIWNFVHYLWFLGLKPDYVSHMFEDDDHILWKGFTNDELKMGTVVQNWVLSHKYKFMDIRLPTLHICILVWLFLPLLPYLNNENTIIIPRIIFPINNKVTYYKLPNPRKIYSLLSFF